MIGNFDKDAEVLAKLLREYTSSLESALVGRTKLDFQAWWTAVGFTFAAFSLSVFTFNFIQAKEAVYIISAAILVGIVFTYFTLLGGKLRGNFRDEIEVLARKLDKIARRASQQMEHAKPSFAIELELDLRLTEAESALRKAERFVGSIAFRDEDYSIRKDKLDP